MYSGSGISSCDCSRVIRFWSMDRILWIGILGFSFLGFLGLKFRLLLVFEFEFASFR